MMRTTQSQSIRRHFITTAALIVFAALIWTGASTTASAVEPTQETLGSNDTPETGTGFYLGILFMGSSLHVDESDEDVFFVKDDGGGVLFKAGYGFNPVFSLELALGGTRHDTSESDIDAGLGFVQLFALYRFAPNHPFRPYIKGGLGGYGLTLDAGDIDVRTNGGGLAFGGGFDYFFSPHFALGVDFTHNIIHYDKIELQFGGTTLGEEIDEEGSMSSLGLALTYFF